MNRNYVFAEDQRNGATYVAASSTNYTTLYLAFILAYLLSAWIVQLTWNYTLPDLFGISQIGYLQSIAILILINLLFGAIGSSCVQMVSAYS